MAACGAAVVFAFFAVGNERNRLALGALLVAGGSFLVALWLWGAPGKVHLMAWLAFAAAFAVLGLPLLAALAVLGAVGVLVLSVLAVARSYRRLGELEIESSEFGAVMPGAERAVTEFEAAGFRRAGAYQSTIDDKRAVFTALLGPAQDRCAVVTDAVVELISTFDGRFLATANSASVPRIPALLRQQVARDTDVLLLAHQAAIDLLARRASRRRP